MTSAYRSVPWDEISQLPLAIQYQRNMGGLMNVNYPSDFEGCRIYLGVVHILHTIYIPRQQQIKLLPIVFPTFIVYNPANQTNEDR